MPKRYTLLSPERLSAEQRRIYERICSGPRGTVPDIFQLLLESPPIVDHIQRLGAFLRYSTGLGPNLSELAILVIAQYWKCDYEWSIHVKEARAAGLGEDTIEAILAGRTPNLQGDEAIVYDFVTAVFAKQQVPDALFETAIARFGRTIVLNMAAMLGYYSMLAVIIRVYELPPAPD